MSYSVFERELKAILHGDELVVRRIIKNCDSDTHFNYLKILEKPFLVIRAAGSFGVDLVAVRSDISFPIEAKASTSKNIFLSSERTKKQAIELREECERAGMFPIYAQRLKGQIKEDPWHVSTIDIDGLKGSLKTLHDFLPNAHMTSSGNIALRWSDGMPLNKFINYLCHTI